MGSAASGCRTGLGGSTWVRARSGIDPLWPSKLQDAIPLLRVPFPKVFLRSVLGQDSGAQPQLPVRPNRLLNLILGLVLGALLSIGSVFIVELMRDTVLTPRELEVLTGKRVLVSVPKNGRAPRPVVVVDESPELSEPRLSQPKIVSERQFEWVPD